MSDLNLLRSKRRAYGEQGSLRIIKTVSYISLGIVLLSSLILFLLNITSDIPKIKKEDQSVSSSLSLLTDKIAKFLMMKNRVSEAGNIILKRSDFSQVLDIVLKDMPAALAIESFSVDQKGILINISSSSLADLDEFLTNLEKEPTFKKITLENLALDEKGGKYQVALNVIFK